MTTNYLRGNLNITICKYLVMYLVVCASSTLKAQGDLWGLSSIGGANGKGIIFKTTFDGSGYTIMYDFGSSANDGFLSYGNGYNGLTLAANGKLYGVTDLGGTVGVGTIFEYDISTNTYTKKIDLDGTAGTFPTGSLVLADNGKLYGMTNNTTYSTSPPSTQPERCDACGNGAIFEYDPSTNIYSKKYDSLTSPFFLNTI